MGSAPFVNNPVTTDPVRYARNAAILAEDPTLGLAAPTVAWLDTSFKAMHAFKAVDYPGRIRQPVLILAAGSDAIGLTAGDAGVCSTMAAGFTERVSRC